jgi:hypothetical protein
MAHSSRPCNHCSHGNLSARFLAILRAQLLLLWLSAVNILVPVCVSFSVSGFYVLLLLTSFVFSDLVCSCVCCRSILSCLAQDMRRTLSAVQLRTVTPNGQPEKRREKSKINFHHLSQFLLKANRMLPCRGAWIRYLCSLDPFHSKLSFTY